MDELDSLRFTRLRSSDLEPKRLLSVSVSVSECITAIFGSSEAFDRINLDAFVSDRARPRRGP